MTNFFKFFLAGVFLMTFLTIRPDLSECNDRPNDVVRFSWTIIHKPKEGAGKNINIKEIPTLSEGDTLQIFLHPQKNAYLYLFLLDSRKVLSLLFPPSISDYDNNEPWDNEYYLPSKDSWFYVDDHAGIEKFYLLASSSQLTELENLTAIFLSKPDLNDLQARVLGEIKKIQTRFSSIAGRGEKGVSIAGTIKTRSPQSIEEDSHIQVDASQFYGKTIRFKHE